MAKKTWRNSGCYLWRTRKPTAFIGLSLRWLLLAAVLIALGLYLAGSGWWWLAFLLVFFSGRHNGYVGQTSSRYFRDRQHIFGDSRYGQAGKAWSDLDPKCYPLPCLFPRWKWARKSQEALWIWILLPVYNVELNKKNPRRITPTKAQQQRWARQQMGMKVNITRVLARWALGLVVFAGATYSAWEAWVA